MPCCTLWMAPRARSSSGELIDIWNHYGGLALSNGQIYITTYDARVYAFGLKK